MSPGESVPPGETGPPGGDGLAEVLAAAGFVAADEEADELRSAAAGSDELLTSLVGRRLAGEPLAWITGRVAFCGVELRVDPGVYVPRWQTEPLARRAVARLPPSGVAVDLCTGTGALAAVLAGAHPAARVVATDLDPRAVACARANRVEAYCGDLFAPLTGVVSTPVDLVTGVVPYVPTTALSLLPRDTLAFEPPASYDGGPDGTDILRRALSDSTTVLRPGGGLLLELGGEQADLLGDDLDRLGYRDVVVLRDADGDVRGIEATFA